jgi:hypothetical protein
MSFVVSVSARSTTQHTPKSKTSTTSSTAEASIPTLRCTLVQAVRRLETQIESLKSELEWEQEHNVATEGEAHRARAELEVQLSASQMSERVLQQVCAKCYAVTWPVMPPVHRQRSTKSNLVMDQ